MKKEEKDCCEEQCCDDKCCKGVSGNAAASGAIYGLGFVGALIYFIQQAGGVWWMWIVGIGKALIWPALLVYKALELLKF